MFPSVLSGKMFCSGKVFRTQLFLLAGVVTPFIQTFSCAAIGHKANRLEQFEMHSYSSLLVSGGDLTSLKHQPLRD